MSREERAGERKIMYSMAEREGILTDHTIIACVLFCVESYCCEADGFAGPPADALEGEDCVGVVG